MNMNTLIKIGLIIVSFVALFFAGRYVVENYVMNKVVSTMQNSMEGSTGMMQDESMMEEESIDTMDQ